MSLWYIKWLKKPHRAMPEEMSLGNIQRDWLFYKQRYNISLYPSTKYQGYLQAVKEPTHPEVEPREFLCPKQWGLSVLAIRCCSHFTQCPVSDLDYLVVLHGILCLEYHECLSFSLPGYKKRTEFPPHCHLPHLGRQEFVNKCGRG